MKRVIALTLTLALLLCGCAQKSAEREFFAMDTVMQLRAYGPEADRALAEAEAEIYRLGGGPFFPGGHAGFLGWRANFPAGTNTRRLPG